MANYKIVDSNRLDADLTTVADAIRAKSGASAALAFPEGFVASVSKIPTGNGTELPELKDPGSAEDLVWGKEMIDGDGNVVTGKFELLSTEIAENAFLYAPNVGVREANGSKRIYFNTSIASRIGYEAGAPIQMEAVTANFGNAKPEDVIDGATFTSEEGLNVSGKIPFLPTGQQGALGVVTEVRRVNYASYPVLRSLTQMPMRVAFDTNSIFQSDTPFHMLPDAEPNLVPGNIKKDVSIFNIVGTYESSDNGNNGIDLPTLSNPGSAEDLFHGKQLIDADGKIVNGTMEYITAENTSFILPSSNAVEYEDAYGKRVMMSIQLPSRLAFDTGSTVRMQSNLTNFGAAKPEDVIDGATFTSAEGLNVSGTLPFLPAGQRAYIGLADEAKRVDYAAYPVVRATAPIRVRLAMEAESSAQVDIPFGRLPGAEPNLLAENIRKGVSIFDVVGTFEGSGGGSGVISAVAAGTYTPASDSSSGVEIEHGLGVTPNFCIWMAENDFSDITDVSAVVVGAMVAKPMLHSVSSGMTYPYQYFLRGYNVSGLSNGTASYKSDGCMTDTIVTILGNSTYKLKSGWTYHWICGVADSFA